MSEKPNPEERGRQLSKAEQDERQRMAQGVIKPRFSEEESRLVKDAVNIAAMARQISTTRISIKNFDANGQLVDSAPSAVGHEELILMALLQTRLGRNERA